MSLRRRLRCASGLLILGICMQFASVLPQGELRAQTAPKAGDGSGASAQEQQKIAASAIKIPLFFEANAGQTDPSVRFLTRSGGYTMFLTPTETVLVEGKNGIVSGDKLGKGLTAFRADAKNSKQSVLRMELLGANTAPEFHGLQELPGKVNYLIGKDEAAWHTNVALFSEVQVTKVYPGVDLLFHGDQRQLEYDFVVAPGADPGRIGFKIRGAKKIEIAANGDLILHTADSEFEMRKPVIYQGEGANRSEVRGEFVLSAKNQVRFELGPYDHAEQLVIDPVIFFSSFLGGAGLDLLQAVAVDTSTPGAPKVYVTGFADDMATFPESSTNVGNPSTAAGGENVFVAEIDATKTGSGSLVYLTFIGGSTPFTALGGTLCGTASGFLALDTSQGAGSVEPVLGGQTLCSDYPGTVLNPVTATGTDASATVVTRLKPGGAAIDASVVLGGNGLMATGYVFTDAAGNVLLTGATGSTNLPISAGAYATEFNNGATGAFDDCYTVKLARSNLTPGYFSYLNVGAGSTSGQAAGCGGVIDASNENILYLGGDTESSVAFSGAAAGVLGFQSTFHGTIDSFVMKLDTSVSGFGALKYATYVGGGGATDVQTGAVDLGTGVVALAGRTTSNSTTNAPDIVTGNALSGGSSNPAAASTGGQAGFLVVMDTTKSGLASLLSGSYFGGSSGQDEIRALAYDPRVPAGYNIIVGGDTASTDFPVLHPFQGSLVGTQDAFVSSFLITPTSAQTLFSSYIGAGGVSIGGVSVAENSIAAIGVDTGHAMYVGGNASSGSYFDSTTPATTVNGFQTTCTSCSGTVPEPDAIIFALKTAPGAALSTVSAFPASVGTLAVGGTQQFSALGLYGDGTFQDLTSEATWNSSNTGVLQIGSTGLATAVGSGTATITAQFGGQTSAGVLVTVSGGATTFKVQLVLEGAAYGTVTDSTGAINCTNTTAQGATGTCTANFNSNAQVTLTETPGAGSVFGGWGISNVCPGTIATCTFTITADQELSATFNNGTGNFALNVIPGANATGGGIVLGNIGGTGTTIDCTLNGTTTPTGVCTQNILSGSITTLTAEQNVTSNFTSWSGPCVIPTGQPAKCIVTMGAAHTVTAVFTAQTSSFTVALTGNGTVTSTSTPTVTPEINCANPAPPSVCTTNFTSGTQVTLTATAATGYSFANWTAGPCSGNTNPCVFTVTSTSKTSATALFTINSYLLTVNRAGTLGGTVTSNPVSSSSGKINCGPAAGTANCSINAVFNTQVILTETPPSGGGFGGWSGTPTACTVGATTCTFNMPAGPETVTATFTTSVAPSPVLTISKSHVGDFTVGDTADTYTVTVSNAGGAGPTNGTVTVTDTIPSGLALDSMAGTGWTCEGNSCTRSDVLRADASYPAITVTVAVASDATSPQVNSVTVSGGGSASATATDSTVILGGVSTQLIVADFNVNGEGDEDKQRVDGTSKPLQVTLTNTSSTQTVHVSGVTPTAPYTATTDCGTLAPGGTCHLFIGFKPASVCQDQTDQILTVNDDDPGGNFQMTIHGWGADSVIKVDDLTDSTLTPTALAQSLVGAGVAISNVKYTGALRAAGTFTSSSNVLGFTNGIVLSSGSARNVAGMNCENGMSVDNGEPGDADLNTIVGEGNITNDASVLEFDFVPTSSTISFQYVFGSEEYPDFIGSFNDVFGFFLTAPGGAPVNLALIPGTDLPVSINDVNDGNTTVTPPIPPTNPQFYVNNQVQFSATGPLPPVDTELNGLTTVLTAQATVTPGLTYHIKLAVADANDFALDSNVFVQAGSLSSANVTANPTSLTFGSQAQGTTSASQPVVITNVGTTNVTITGIAASANFGETNSCPATLATGTGTGSSCTVNVTFAPTATGTLTGTVTVTYTSAGSTTPQTTTIVLTGTGTPATGGTITIAPTSLTFSAQAVGTTSAGQNLTVSNTGGTAVTFTSIVTSGDFSGATLAQCPSLAVESEPCVFSITFKPTATGTRTGTITFTDNATGSPQAVTLTGTGTGGAATVTVTPSSLTFGSQALTTTSAPLSVTVTNNSTGAVNFSGFTVSGANAGDFGVPLPNTSSGCSSTGTLAAGGSCTIGVVFTPSANGARTATLNIADNATGSPQTVALSGTGVTSQVIIAIAPGGSSTATTVSGGTAYYGLVISGAPGVTGTVQLGCIPSSVLITCNVIPSSVTLTGGSTEVAFAIQTFCQGTPPATGFVPPVGGVGGGIGLVLVSMVFGGAMWTFRRNRRVALTFATLLLVALGSAACSNSLPQGPNGATPAGTYTLSLTTTLNGQTQTLNNFLTLVVK